jgi:hypothetical protein
MRTFALLAFGLVQASAAFAQDMTPGLWSMTNTVSSPNAQLQAAMGELRQQLAGLPTERRQAMQQMLQQNGIQLDLGAGGALQSRVCLTREMIARKKFPVQEGDCNVKTTALGTNRLQVNFSCARPHASGTGDMTIDTPTHYRARLRVTSADQPDQVVDMDVDGRWLAADCGNVRPVRLPDGK